MLPVVSACFHPAQEALVSDRSSVLLAAEMAAAGARGRRDRVLGDPMFLRVSLGAGGAEPQASGLTCDADETAVVH